MNPPRIAQVAALLVAWHNRHPFARRVSAADVNGVGVVALPHAQQPEGDAQADRGARPLYGSDWLDGAPLGRLQAWMARHGRPSLPGCEDWPQRLVDAALAPAQQADAEGLTGRSLRWAVTANLSVAGHRTRVLIDLGAGRRWGRVFGHRLWHPMRCSGFGAALTGVAAGVIVALWPAPDRPESAHATAAQPSPAAHVARLQTSIASTDSAPAALTAASTGPAAWPERTASAPAEAPQDRTITLLARAPGSPGLVDIRPALSAEQQQAARRQAAALRPASAPVAKGPQFAIVTRASRSRDDADAQRVALQGLAAQTRTPAPTRLDVMHSGREWRVVWWPHPQRRSAEGLLAQARARGLKVELIDF